VNIVGLGSAGCKIAQLFEAYPQYTVYKIDTHFADEDANKKCYTLKEQPHPERYEETVPSLKKFFRGAKGEVLFVTCGSGFVSGASLAVLQQLQHCETTILYIKPDTSLLGQTNILQEKVVHGVLQEYARSGVFDSIYTVDNVLLEEIVEAVSVAEYYQKLNELIASTFHMINVFDRSSSEISTFSALPETSRLRTIGLLSMEGEEKPFFSIDNVTEKRYYYGLSKKSLEDGEIFKKIKKAVKSSSTERVKSSYAIFSTDYEDDYGYCVFYSSQVQESP
tara:strand:+ start:3127 stop:3963 length:837 start_codon:yes stop_codon:yes gene_type:complete